jgi:putative salt-induced outer membrane protein YdiY
MTIWRQLRRHFAAVAMLRRQSAAIAMRRRQSAAVTMVLAVVLAMAAAAAAATPPKAGRQQAVRTNGRKTKGAKRHPVRLHQPHEPWQGWKGTGSLGYSMTTGDTQSRSISANLHAVRGGKNGKHGRAKWQTLVNATLLFSHSSSNSGAVIQSDTVSGGVREDRALSKQNFLFAMAQLDYIQPQGIRLRQTYGGGYGRDLWQTKRLTFSGLLGMTYVHTAFAPVAGAPVALTQNSAELLVGENLTLKLAHGMKIIHDLEFYPNLSQTGQYRFDTNTAFAAPISKRLSFTLSYVEFYLSHPLPGNHKNNSTLAAGLGVTF